MWHRCLAFSTWTRESVVFSRRTSSVGPRERMNLSYIHVEHVLPSFRRRGCQCCICSCESLCCDSRAGCTNVSHRTAATGEALQPASVYQYCVAGDREDEVSCCCGSRETCLAWAENGRQGGATHARTTVDSSRRRLWPLAHTRPTPFSPSPTLFRPVPHLGLVGFPISVHPFHKCYVLY